LLFDAQVNTKTFGPLQELMDNPEIEEVWINSPNRIFIARKGMSELTNLTLTFDEVRKQIPDFDQQAKLMGL
jgi:type IV secretory pathway ATPase VirB11/archaellum biosynthesis ATPase